MKFYDIDVLAKKYGGGNKYLATSLIAESACRLSEKRNPDDNDPEKEKYLSEVLAQFERGVDVETILRVDDPKEESQEDVPQVESPLEEVFAVKAADE